MYGRQDHFEDLFLASPSFYPAPVSQLVSQGFTQVKFGICFLSGLSDNKELYEIQDISGIVCNNGMVFAQVLWGTNGTMKADLDNRHIKEDQCEEVEETKHAIK